MMSASVAMAGLILGPLMAAALAFGFPRWGRWLALGTAGGVSAAGIRLLALTGIEGIQVHRVGGWGAPLGIDLRADGLAVLMLLITAVVGVAVTLYALRYFEPHTPAPAHGTPTSSGAASRPGPGAAGGYRTTTMRERYFWPLFLFLWCAQNALFLSADIFNLYVTLELLGLSAVSLVALAGQRAALTAAMRYLLVSLAASLFYLMGVALVYGECGTVDLLLLGATARSGPAVWVALALLSGGLVMKAALFPMHFWLPPAHANAPAPVSALLSALVVKGAIYILLRLWFEAFTGLLTPAVAMVFGLLGVAAIFWGSINAFFQARLKLLVAYSTVAQLGYMFLIFPLALPRETGFGAWSGALLFLGAHACAKTAMFLSAGNLLRAAGHDRIRELAGITQAMPLSVFAFALSGMSLVGLPPSGGFAGKWLMLSAALHQGRWGWAVVMLLGSLLAAAYVMRVLIHVFVRLPGPVVANPVPRVMEWTALGLALVAALLGFGAGWPTEWLRWGAPVAGPALPGGWVP